MSGFTLDIGGGDKNSYHHLLRIKGRIETINIDPNIGPTHVWDLNQPLPFADGTYDNIISLNTFEHIFDDQMAVSEALRVLRSGGTFHFVVPFLYRVHGSPSDYHRHTADWWRRFIGGQGISTQRFVVEPLVWDPQSSAQTLTGLVGGFRRALILSLAFVDPGYWARLIVARIPGLRARPWRPGASPVSAEDRRRAHREEAARYALGYYIHGTK